MTGIQKHSVCDFSELFLFRLDIDFFTRRRHSIPAVSIVIDTQLESAID